MTYIEQLERRLEAWREVKADDPLYEHRAKIMDEISREIALLKLRRRA